MGFYIGQSAETAENIMLLEAGLATQTPAILWGPPGIGKTELVRAIARKHNLPLFILLASTMDPTDINGLPAIKEMTIERPDGSKEVFTATEPTLQYWAEALIREGKGILFFDEANNAVPAVQSTLLSVLQGRIVGRHVLPDEVWMIAASNDTADAADGWELAPPMANRFMHIEFHANLEDWYGGMVCNWGADVAENDVEAQKRYLTLQRSRTEVAGFVKQHPALLHAMPSTATEAGKAWPSPRSWDSMARILAVVPKSDGTNNARYRAISGLVGEAAATQYDQYERGLKLPQYEDVINNPGGIDWKVLSPAEIRLVLDMVIANINESNLKATVTVLTHEGLAHHADILTAVASPAITKFAPYLRTSVENRKTLMKYLTNENNLKLIKDAGIVMVENGE